MSTADKDLTEHVYLAVSEPNVQCALRRPSSVGGRMDPHVPVNLASLKAEDFRAFIDSFDTVITDCDGVLYKIYDVIPGVVNTINKLREMKKDVRFLSNNTSLGLDQFHKKLTVSGFNSKREDVIYPTLAIVQYLKKMNFDKKIFFMGFEAVKQDFINAGIKIAESGPTVTEENVVKIRQQLVDDEEIGAVVIEIDINMNYMKLMKSAIYLRRPDVMFLVGTTDNKIPSGKGFTLGPGYFFKILEDFTGRKATVFGKPSEHLYEYVKEKFEISNPQRTLFVGDSLYQDMSFASYGGYQKLLVLTGVNNLDDVKEADATHKPDYYISSLGDLDELIKNNL